VCSKIISNQSKMKSLVRKKESKVVVVEAQCCAKKSKKYAGCHD